MKTSEIEFGQIVAVSRGLAAKHLNVVDDEEADLELAEKRIGGLSAMILLMQGRREWLAWQLRDRAWSAWETHKPPHRATALQVSLPWGGRRTGVLVELEPDERITKYLRVLDIPKITAIVPASMVEDYWDCMAELEEEKHAIKAQAEVWADRRIEELREQGLLGEGWSR